MMNPHQELVNSKRNGGIAKPILIVNLNMIPYSKFWSGCQRMYFLAEYLQKTGFDVFLVHKKDNYFGDFGHNISFHAIPIPINYFVIFYYFKKILGIFSYSNNKSFNSRNTKLHQKIVKIKHAANFAYTIFEKRVRIFNDVSPVQGIIGKFFVKNAKKSIFELVKANNIKIIIISGPPFSFFELAEQLKKKFNNVNVILDYRDPWNLWNGGSWLSCGKEKKYLQLADKVVFVNDRLMNDMVDKYGIEKHKCEVILNGYSEGDWEKVLKNYKDNRSNTDRLIISYIGTVSFGKWGYRDLSAFWTALERFEYKNRTTIRFVGVNTTEKTEKLKKRFTDSVEFIPRVFHEQSLDYMLCSDVLFMLHTHDSAARYIITGKFFDYIKSGKVLLGIANKEDTYFLDLIKTHQLGIAALNNADSIVEALNNIYYKWENGTLAELRNDVEFDIEKYSRDNQNNRYMGIIEDIIV